METNEVTEKIIGCAFAVANTLGSGFLEKVYENALTHEAQKAGLIVRQQVPIHVNYDGIIVGEFVKVISHPIHQTILIHPIHLWPILLSPVLQ